MPELVLYLRSREVRRVPILSAELTIGRDETSDVMIDNAGVSRTHAVLSFRDGGFRIRDAGSENGITVNGRAVQTAELSYGDVIGITKYKLQFSQDGGVPVEMLMPPTKQIGGHPTNIVSTMTINTEAARKLQEEFLAKKRARARSAARASRPSLLNRVLGLALVLALGAVGYAIYKRQQVAVEAPATADPDSSR